MKVVNKLVDKIKSSSLVMNSVWGIMANILQNAFNSLFFVLIARYYAADQLANFLVSNTIYQLVAVFASMGLSSWFIREYTVEINKTTFVGYYFKLQGILGILFYLINIFVLFILYEDHNIRIIGLVLGVNILFDNIINSIKTLNIAKLLQKHTANILIIDGFLRMLASAVCVIMKLPIIYLAFALVIARIVTLNIFVLTKGSYKAAFDRLGQSIMSYESIKSILFSNWRFVVIGSVSVVYWSFANIAISKFMPLSTVSQYEAAFRIFSLAIVIPIIISGSVYPQFVKYYNVNDAESLKNLYNKVFVLYIAFSLLGYSFVASFAPKLVPFIFGEKYQASIVCLIQMFLTILIFPTILLQANIIVAMKMENLDMWFNVMSLAFHVALTTLGLAIYKSLAVVNYSVFASFLVFHISQDIVLVRRGITSLSKCLSHYALLGGFITLYPFALHGTNVYLAFMSTVFVVVLIVGFSQGAKALISLKLK